MTSLGIGYLTPNEFENENLSKLYLICGLKIDALQLLGL